MQLNIKKPWLPFAHVNSFDASGKPSAHTSHKQTPTSSKEDPCPPRHCSLSAAPPVCTVGFRPASWKATRVSHWPSSTAPPPTAFSCPRVYLHPWTAPGPPGHAQERRLRLASHLAGCGRAGAVLPVAGQHVGGLVNQNFPDDLQGLVQDCFESCVHKTAGGASFSSETDPSKEQ